MTEDSFREDREKTHLARRYTGGGLLLVRRGFLAAGRHFRTFLFGRQEEIRRGEFQIVLFGDGSCAQRHANDGGHVCFGTEDMHRYTCFSRQFIVIIRQNN